MKKRLIVLLTSLIAVMTLVTGVITVAASGSVSWQVGEIRSEYSLNENFVVPDATCTSDGATVRANYSVVLPGGETTAEKSFILSKTGNYSVEYVAKINDKFYNFTKRFAVKADAISYDESNSSVQYCTTTEYGSNVCNTGLLVSLAQNDVLTFNELIDVSSLTLNDSLIGAYVIPSVQGSADFNGLQFTLYDSQDDEQKLTITVIRHSSDINYNYLSYVKAGATGQPLSGYEHAWSTLHVNDEWGTAIHHSFTASFGNGTPLSPSDKRIELFYDSAENALYTKEQTSSAPYIVADFDSADYYTALWAGFPSGKARLSVSAFNYEGRTAKFFIYNVFGIDLNGITEREVQNTSAPVITVNAPETIPFAQVGSSYALFDATAYNDYDGECLVNASVYYDYYNENARASVAVKDGKFIPTTDGVYTIVYSSKNSFGAEGTECVDVVAKKKSDIPQISVTPISEPKTECNVGEVLELAEVELSGGSGTLVLKKTITCGDTEIVVEGDSVIVPSSGVWQVKCVVTDYVGNTGEYAYNVTVNANGEPIFYPEPETYPIMLNGGSYVFNEFYAKVYAANGSAEEHIAYVEVTDDNGTKSYKTGVDKYVPSVSANEQEVTAKYYVNVNGAKKYFEKEYKIKVVIPFVKNGSSDKIVMGNYFVTNGTEKTVLENGLDITAVNSDGSVVFANTLIGEGLYTEFKTISDKSAFSGVYIKLTDADNSANSIRAELLYDGKNTTFKVCDSSVKLESGFKTADYTFVAKYENGYFSVGNATLPVLTTTNGNEFNGFEDKVFLEYGFIGASEGSAFRVSKIYNQNIAEISKDRASPTIRVNGEVGGRHSLNDVYVFEAAVVGDVLAPNSSLTVSVMTPGKNYVKAEDGTELKNVDATKTYKIKLSEIGSYSVVYTATESDSWGWHFDLSNDYSYGISVTDTVSPVLELKGEFAKSIKLGESILFPDYSVSDDVTSAEELKVSRFVINPYGKIIYIANDSNEFKPDYTGTYRVFIAVTDGVGNRVVYSDTVTVEG